MVFLKPSRLFLPTRFQCSPQNDANLLSAAATSTALLQLENAAPRLLRLLAQSEDADQMATLLDRALDMATLPRSATLDDIREVVSMVRSESA